MILLVVALTHKTRKSHIFSRYIWQTFIIVPTIDKLQLVTKLMELNWNCRLLRPTVALLNWDYSNDCLSIQIVRFQLSYTTVCFCSKTFSEIFHSSTKQPSQIFFSKIFDQEFPEKIFELFTVDKRSFSQFLMITLFRMGLFGATHG